MQKLLQLLRAMADLSASAMVVLTWFVWQWTIVPIAQKEQLAEEIAHSKADLERLEQRYRDSVSTWINTNAQVSFFSQSRLKPFYRDRDVREPPQVEEADVVLKRLESQPLDPVAWIEDAAKYFYSIGADGAESPNDSKVNEAVHTAVNDYRKKYDAAPHAKPDLEGWATEFASDMRLVRETCAAGASARRLHETARLHCIDQMSLYVRSVYDGQWGSGVETAVFAVIAEPGARPRFGGPPDVDVRDLLVNAKQENWFDQH